MRTERPNSLDNIEIQTPDPDPVEFQNAENRSFAGHRALTITFGIVFVLIFVAAMAFDVAFLPLFIPSFFLVICWFRGFRATVTVDNFSWYYGVGFAVGLGVVMYQLAVSFVVNGIWPHDSKLSSNYVVSSFMYSFIGGGFGTEVGRYLLSKKIRSDRKDNEINIYLFVAMAGNLGATTLILLLGNTGSLLKRVDTQVVGSFVLAKAVLVRSILDIILQTCLAYRIEMGILKMGYYNRHDHAWNGLFAGNIIVRGISDVCFFVVGLMQGISGVGGLSGIYLALILIVGIIVRKERKLLNFSFDSTLARQESEPTQQQQGTRTSAAPENDAR